MSYVVQFRQGRYVEETSSRSDGRTTKTPLLLLPANKDDYDDSEYHSPRSNMASLESGGGSSTRYYISLLLWYFFLGALHEVTHVLVAILLGGILPEFSWSLAACIVFGRHY